MKSVVLALGLAASSMASAFQPAGGMWWNPDESGSGYNLVIQNGTLVMTLFSYKTSGDSEWYLAVGPLTNSGRAFTATLDKYRNGQCISCAFKVNTPSGNDGVVSITFQSETSATMTLPGGRTTTIVPFNFYGELPNGLLGEWVFFYDIISTFAERFNFTTLAGPTSTGNGVVADLQRNGTCEFKTSGAFVGTVLCFDFDASLNNVENQYQWRFGIEETFGGIYTFPPSGQTFSMKGLRTKDAKGAARAAPEANDRQLAVKAFETGPSARSLPQASDAELAAEIGEMRAALLRAKR